MGLTVGRSCFSLAKSALVFFLDGLDQPTPKVDDSDATKVGRGKKDVSKSRSRSRSKSRSRSRSRKARSKSRSGDRKKKVQRGPQRSKSRSRSRSKSSRWTKEENAWRGKKDKEEEKKGDKKE